MRKCRILKHIWRRRRISHPEGDHLGLHTLAESGEKQHASAQLPAWHMIKYAY
jgi:hypothetical protein